MALKRKFELDSDDSSVKNAKQLKLIPFPNYEPDTDVLMSDAEPLDFSYHVRIPSNVSSASSSDSEPGFPSSAPAYPTFDLYPLPFFNAKGSVEPNSHNYSYYSGQQTPPAVGLLQPRSGFQHHGTGCSQIPKLRVACAPGMNGQRTMWSLCEQCGAISMVDSE